MRAKRAAPAEPLSFELREVLLRGPWSIHRSLKDFDHDRLRQLWAQHGPALLASLPRGTRAWFEDRDYFVRILRGESP